MAASDYMALRAIDELLARSIQVREQVSVSGFDDVEDSRLAPVPLSTVRQPLREQAERALDLLLDGVSSGQRHRDLILNTEAVVRASCGLLDAPRLKPANDEADAEYEQARERLRQARQLRALRGAGQALSSALDEDQALAALARQLPGIGIPRSLLGVFAGEPAAGRVRRACTSSSPQGVAIRALPELVSLARVLERSAWQGDQHYTAVVEPLFSSTGPHGVVAGRRKRAARARAWHATDTGSVPTALPLSQASAMRVSQARSMGRHLFGSCSRLRHPVQRGGAEVRRPLGDVPSRRLDSALALPQSPPHGERPCQLLPDGEVVVAPKPAPLDRVGLLDIRHPTGAEDVLVCFNADHLTDEE